MDEKKTYNIPVPVLNKKEQQLYTQMMDLVGKGFKTIEEQAARFSISEKQIVAKINKKSKTQITNIEEICLVRSYDVSKALSNNIRITYQVIVNEKQKGKYVHGMFKK